MGRNLLDILCSILLISALIFVIKLIGYYCEKAVRKRHTKLIVGNTEYEVLKDTPNEIWVGGKRLVLSQMKDIINSRKSTHKQIVFLEGYSKTLGKKYAVFANDVIRYVSGKEIMINSEDE